MYTISNNNNPMSVKINDTIWTLGQFNEERQSNTHDKWYVYDIHSQETSTIDIPENIELGNLSIALKSHCIENSIYVASGGTVKYDEEDTFISHNPRLYSYDMYTNSWVTIKTFSPQIILYAMLERTNGGLMLIGQCENNEYVLLSSVQNYQEIRLPEIDGRFGYTFFLDKKDRLWVYGGLDNQINYHNAFVNINTSSGKISYEKEIDSFDFRSFPLIFFHNEDLLIIGGTKDGYYPSSEIIKFDFDNHSLKSIENIQPITHGYFVNFCAVENENNVFIMSGYIFNDKIRQYEFKEHKVMSFNLD